MQATYEIDLTRDQIELIIIIIGSCESITGVDRQKMMRIFIEALRHD